MGADSPQPVCVPPNEIVAGVRLVACMPWLRLVTGPTDWLSLAPARKFSTRIGKDAVGERYIPTQRGGLWNIVPN